MSNTLLATVVIAGVVGASSAAVTGALLAPQDPGTEMREPATKADLISPGLTAEFAALRQQNMELADRIVDLEMQASMASTETRREPAEAAVDPEMEKMKAELASLLASMKGASGDVPASFTATVSSALADIREQEEADRDVKRTERRAERTETRLTEIAEKLGLDSTQVNDLRDHTIAFDAKRQTAFREARELGDFGSIRETMSTLRDENNAALQSIFSPSQYRGGNSSNNSNNDGGGSSRRGRGGF